MAIFMNFDELRVTGNITAQGYQGWIHVESISFDIDRDVAIGSGKRMHPEISEVTITKTLDRATTGLLKETLVGNKKFKVAFDLVRTKPDEIEKWATIELENATISNFAFEADAGGAPVESISFVMRSFSMSYTAADAANTDEAPNRVGYNLGGGDVN